MMRSFLHVSSGWIEPKPWWVSVGVEGWPQMPYEIDGFRPFFHAMPSHLKEGYTRFKESIWRTMHGLPGEFTIGDYLAFREFGGEISETLLGLRDDVDVYYVNDYQQVQVGPMIGPAKPTVFHWHGPARFGGMPAPIAKFCLNSMEAFDAVCVSTERDKKAMAQLGVEAHRVYPFIDENEQAISTEATIQCFRDAYKLGQGPIVLCVARMDEQKRQDLLIEAFAKVTRQFPDARLVLVGNGSFSALGLGQSRSHTWRGKLEECAKTAGISDKVVFTGYLSEPEVQIAYSAAYCHVLPSPVEGFGLVGVEAWLHKKPIVVSRFSGLSELVSNYGNGFVVEPGGHHNLEWALREVLSNGERATKMGEVGAVSAGACFASHASERLRAIFEEVQKGGFSLPE